MGTVALKFAGSFVFGVTVFVLIINSAVVLGKLCTNSPDETNSHTYRASLLMSSNDTWKQEIYSSYVHSHEQDAEALHLVENDESVWSILNPSRKLQQQNRDSSSTSSAVEDMKWTLMYRQMKYDSAFNHANGFLEEVPLHNVRLSPDSLQGRAQQTNLEYLLLLDVDNLVWNFRNWIGLPAPGHCYGGWEANYTELRGHFVGHYMSATAKTWAATQNTTLQKKMEYLVDALYECQQKIGTGYLSAFPPEFFDRFEAIKPVWAPYYTIHKIMTGLLDQYTFAGNGKAFSMVLWMADYFYKRVKNVIRLYSIERHWYSLNEETGGMNDVLYRLYTLSGNSSHLELAHLFDKPCFLGFLAIQADYLSGFHTNTHIPIVIGAQMRYEVTGDPLYRVIGTYFMDIVNSSHAYATGGTSVSEFWSDPKRLATTLGKENEESCTTYNMLKVARNLFRWTKAMAYADYYERAVTNGVLSIQRGNEPGIMIYMLPLKPGASKAHTYHGWGTKFNSFWCCYGTGIESFSKLGDSIYFEKKGHVPSLYIIQFVSSTLKWDLAGLTLQQTVQPLTSWDPTLKVSLQFYPQQANKSAVNVRIPFWTVAKNAKAILNSQQLVLPDPGNFFRIDRKWLPGDKLDLTFPVALRTERISDDRPEYSSLQSILFGPVLLAGMTEGDWNVNIGNSQILGCIKPVSPADASKIFSFTMQLNDGRIMVISEDNEYIRTSVLPEKGTIEAAKSTFRIVENDDPGHDLDTSKEASALQFAGKIVSLELFHRPGFFIAHQGINNNVTVAAQQDDRTKFKVVAGLDGKENSITFEALSHPGCFLHSQKTSNNTGSVQLKCGSSNSDSHFGYNFITGLTSYSPISFILEGFNRKYLLFPLYAYKDEQYTVYFNVTKGI